jgi:hypothetical protein
MKLITVSGSVFKLVSTQKYSYTERISSQFLKLHSSCTHTHTHTHVPYLIYAHHIVLQHYIQKIKHVYIQDV